MERPGEKLKRVREKLALTYRDVEQASRQIAARRGSDEFIIALSRLADIENKGTAPTIHRHLHALRDLPAGLRGGVALVWRSARIAGIRGGADRAARALTRFSSPRRARRLFRGPRIVKST